MTKQTDQRLNRLYPLHCSGLAVPVLSLRTILKAGQDADLAGLHDDLVGQAMRRAAELVAESREPAPRSSPWGGVDHAERLGPDVWSVSTPSHGGFKVSADAMARIPAPWRETPYSQGGWFEEDCDWCIPYLALRLDRFEPTPERGEDMREHALRCFTNWKKADPRVISGAALPWLAHEATQAA